MTPAHQAAYRVAIDADKAWHDELVRLYGRQAGDARYDTRGTSTPRLEELWRACRQANKALQVAAQGSQP